MKNTFFDRLTLLVLSVSLALGQLSRVQIGNDLAFYWHDLCLVFYLLWQMIHTFPERKKIFKNLKKIKIFQNKIVFLLIALILLAWFWQIVQHQWSWAILLYTARLIVYCCSTKILLKHLPQSSRWIFRVCLVILGLGLVQYFFLPDLRFIKYAGYDEHFYRLTSTLLDPAFAGLIFVCALIYADQHYDGQKFRLLYLLLVIGILLTFSRATYLTFLLLSIFLFWQRNNKFYLFTLGLFFLTLPLLPTQSGGEGVNLLRRSSIDSRFANDLQILQNLSPIECLIGRGLFNPNLENSLYADHAHFADNWLVFLLSNLGLLGTILVLKLLLQNMRELWKTRNITEIAYCLALLTHASFNHDLNQSTVILIWLILEGENRTQDSITRVNRKELSSKNTKK